ncbi:MAG TPA: hypothetical protein PK661_10400 [Syntrophorhabdaceae bacterium]|nr:hypothetical protein [Syntrophorhabdaceae bacterium]
MPVGCLNYSKHAIYKKRGQADISKISEISEESILTYEICPSKNTCI